MEFGGFPLKSKPTKPHIFSTRWGGSGSMKVPLVITYHQLTILTSIQEISGFFNHGNHPAISSGVCGGGEPGWHGCHGESLRGNQHQGLQVQGNWAIGFSPENSP